MTARMPWRSPVFMLVLSLCAPMAVHAQESAPQTLDELLKNVRQAGAEISKANQAPRRRLFD